jgi:cell division protein ZapA
MTDTLEIKLLGKDYKVACNDEERDSLLAAVALLEGKIADFGKVAKGGGERVAVMAALDLAHELTTLRMQPAAPAVDASTATDALESETIQRRINSIEVRVAAALEQHKRLF